MADIFSLSVVLLRTVSLLIVAGALSAIPAAWAVIRQMTTGEQGSDPLDIPIVVGAVSHLLLASLLFAYAKRIAGFMTRDLTRAEIRLNEAESYGVHAVALSILGAYVLVYAIPTVFKIVLIEVLPVDNYGSEAIRIAGIEKAGVPVEVIVEYVVQLALGLWLILGSKGIAKWLRGFWMKNISANSTE